MKIYGKEKRYRTNGFGAVLCFLTDYTFFRKQRIGKHGDNRRIYIAVSVGFVGTSPLIQPRDAL